MKVHRPLDDILRGKGMVRLLRVLLRHPAPISAPELACTTGLALSHVQGALRVLEIHGLVDREIAGRTHLWTLSERNALLEPLRSLFEAELQLEASLVDELATGLRRSPVEGALLFGSVARGDETGSSDVDLFVQIAAERDREKVWNALVPLAGRVRDRFGLNLAPLVVTREEARKSLGRQFVSNLRRDGKPVKAGG
jgi:predicted nucleotidyltransferase